MLTSHQMVSSKEGSSVLFTPHLDGEVAFSGSPFAFVHSRFV
jgi:hypothetical protein